MADTHYLITAKPDSNKLIKAVRQLQYDIEQKQKIGQCFFYADGVFVATLESYPAAIEALIDLAMAADIDLYVCSAGFQKRGLVLSSAGKQDFIFKGLGQFIAETQYCHNLRQF